MNHGSALQSGSGEDPAVKALTHIFEKAALVNYKQVFAQLEGVHENVNDVKECSNVF